MGSIQDPSFVTQFLVVEFKEPSVPDLDRRRSVVPIRCLTHDGNVGELSKVFYAPPPYSSNKKLQAINRVVLSGEAVPNTWQEYNCTILCRCATLEGAAYFLKNPNPMIQEVVVEEATPVVPNRELVDDPSAITFDNGSEITPMQIDTVSNSTEQTQITEDEDRSGNFEQTDDQGLQNTSESVDVNLIIQTSLKSIVEEQIIGLIRWMDKKFTAIDLELHSLDIKLTDVGEQVAILRRAVNEQHQLNLSNLTLENMTEKFGMSFPLRDMESFKKFEEKLSNGELRNSMAEFLENRIVKKTSLCKSMSSILRKFVTKEIMQQCTSTKKIGSKLVFCKTEFYKLIEGPMSVVFKDKNGKPVDDDAVKRSVGQAINSSSDWTTPPLAVAENTEGSSNKRPRTSDVPPVGVEPVSSVMEMPNNDSSQEISEESSQ